LKDLEEVAGEARRNGSHVLVTAGDVSKENAVGRVAKQTLEEFDAVDILINNAGILPQSARVGVQETSVKDWERIIDVDLSGVFLCTKYFLGHMKARGEGHIINIASMSGKVAGNGLLSSYRAAKHGVLGFSKTLAKDVKEHGISVSTICPGDVDTELIPGRHNLRSEMLRPDDIAEVALFLATRPVRLCIPEVSVLPRYEI
jgi:3-oxoacyl-[acyl-carrier protein] reductase